MKLRRAPTLLVALVSTLPPLVSGEPGLSGEYAPYWAVAREVKVAFAAVAGGREISAVARALEEPESLESSETEEERSLLDGFEYAPGEHAGLLRPPADGDEAGLQGGFDDAAVSAMAPGTRRDAVSVAVDRGGERFAKLSGSLSLGSAYNYAQDRPERGEADYRGLSRMRIGLDLELDLDLPLGLEARVSGRGFRDLAYRLKKRSEFTREVLELYESELELKEAWVRGSLGKQVDFQIGRQVLAWGSSETLRVLDVLSPIDNRDPGLTDLRDLRLPVTATRVSAYQGPYKLTGIAIHESRYDDMPPFGSDFFPLEQRPPREIRRANGGGDTEFAVALSGRFEGFDATLNWARYFDDEPHRDFRSQLLEHSELHLIGASADVPWGNWLVRMEAARIEGLEFFGSRKKLRRNDVMLGLEYSGFADTQLTLELVHRKLFGYEDRILEFPDAARENTFEASLRYTRSYMNDRARLTALFIVLGQQAQDGTVARVSLDYDLRDALTIGAGILVFEEGELTPFNVFDPNDRIFVNLRYSF